MSQRKSPHSWIFVSAQHLNFYLWIVGFPSCHLSETLARWLSHCASLLPPSGSPPHRWGVIRGERSRVPHASVSWRPKTAECVCPAVPNPSVLDRSHCRPATRQVLHLQDWFISYVLKFHEVIRNHFLITSLLLSLCGLVGFLCKKCTKEYTVK